MDYPSEGRETFVTNLVAKKTDFITMDIKDQDITVRSDVAWVRHTISAEIVDNGNKNNVNLKLLLVWTKVDGIWKLLARQAVRA